MYVRIISGHNEFKFFLEKITRTIDIGDRGKNTLHYININVLKLISFKH